MVVGNVSRTIPVGRELRVRLLAAHEDLWVAMTAAYPSALQVTLANQAPVAGDDAFTVFEDSGTSNLDVLANDTDANLDPTTVSISTPPATGTAVARPDGSIDYTPAPDANSPDTFAYQVCDTGGLCDTASVVMTVVAVNDAPGFGAGGSVTLPEDSGPQLIPGWATAISPGPPDESAQSVAFTVTTDNPSLFSVGPTVAADGTLGYTPAPDAHGVAAVTVHAVDTGGTSGGGLDTSAPQMVTITIGPVNDAPSFTVGPDVTIGSFAGPQFLAAWATAISAGPVDESGQVLTFVVVDDNPTLFSVPPTIGPAGTLTFTPNGGTTGTAAVTVILRDDGGTLDGGTDTSPASTFTIVVT